MRQLVLNLLLNALDAVSAGGHVSIWLRESRPEPNASIDLATQGEVAAGVYLEVADDGCGLTPELGDRIFEPFVTTKDAGMGLGLAICRRIAEAHGGELHAADRSPKGAVFTVRLPVAGAGLIAED
jgi:signal transduction histidine kinase